MSAMNGRCRSDAINSYFSVTHKVSLRHDLATVNPFVSKQQEAFALQWLDTTLQCQFSSLSQLSDALLEATAFETHAPPPQHKE